MDQIIDNPKDISDVFWIVYDQIIFQWEYVQN